MGSVQDKIMCRMLFNECQLELLRTVLPLTSGKPDLFMKFSKEFSQRAVYREFQFFKETAKDIMSLNKTLEEAKKIIKT